MSTSSFPKKIISWSIVTAVLVLLASLMGLLAPITYAAETFNWTTQAKGQDIGNLIAVAALIASSLLIARGSIKALYVWLGTLFYLVYVYIIYAVAVHFNPLFLIYVAVIGLSFYGIIFVINSPIAKHASFPEHLPLRLTGYTLLGVSLMFALLWLKEIVPALLNGETPESAASAGLWVNPVHVIDLAVALPGMAIAGYLVLKNKPRGLFFAAPLLWFVVLMGSSLVAMMTLMRINGFPDTTTPILMMLIIVALSLFALWRFIRKIT